MRVPNTKCEFAPLDEMAFGKCGTKEEGERRRGTRI
jgi:hypothetical protein